jgi:hypothetical protein
VVGEVGGAGVLSKGASTGAMTIGRKAELRIHRITGVKFGHRSRGAELKLKKCWIRIGCVETPRKCGNSRLARVLLAMNEFDRARLHSNNSIVAFNAIAWYTIRKPCGIRDVGINSRNCNAD